ncbi:MAG: sigma-70 family RNA polymerase sigma factor [Ruminococcus sp.]|nr:sigma-70 family RNA polymerase sigma factor [Ruminococcus sp.]
MSKHSIDANQINHIVTRYSNTILRIASHYADNKYDAEDITQNVFLSLMDKDLNFQSEEELKAYIIRCAINKCKDFHRYKSRRKTINIEDLEPIAAPEKSSILDEVKTLPEKYRVVVYLHYFEGYTLEQIGKILKINPNTAGTRLRRAREKLKDILKEDNYESL